MVKLFEVHRMLPIVAEAIVNGSIQEAVVADHHHVEDNDVVHPKRVKVKARAKMVPLRVVKEAAMEDHREDIDQGAGAEDTLVAVAAAVVVVTTVDRIVEDRPSLAVTRRQMVMDHRVDVDHQDAFSAVILEAVAEAVVAQAVMAALGVMVVMAVKVAAAVVPEPNRKIVKEAIRANRKGAVHATNKGRDTVDADRHVPEEGIRSLMAVITVERMLKQPDR